MPFQFAYLQSSGGGTWNTERETRDWTVMACPCHARWHHTLIFLPLLYSLERVIFKAWLHYAKKT